MWLKDFLPRDVKGIRIMSYGYNTNLVGNTVDDRFLDYRRHFIQMLENSRSSAEERTRPIIFIGHSMGGILILQTLLQSKNGGQYKQLFDSTRAIHFFGTPHQGLEVDGLLSMIDDVSSGQSSRLDFVKQLQEGTNFLATQKEDIKSLWDQTPGIEIVSFYETKMTAVVKKSSSGNWERDDDQVKMVKDNSALLFWPSEHCVPVGRNHRDMVKFSSSEDTTYRTVVTHMTECVNNLATSHVGKDQSDCLKSLDPFDCETYRDNLLLYSNALYAAASSGNEALVRLLVASGPDCNAQGSLYGSTLQAAASSGKEAMIRLLVGSGVGANAQGGEYDNPLHTGASKSEGGPTQGDAERIQPDIAQLATTSTIEQPQKSALKALAEGFVKLFGWASSYNVASDEARIAE